jgi:hypothetical protein
MATDSTLVKGAYNANKGYDIDRSGVSKAINKGAVGLSKAVKERKKNEEASKEVDKSSSLEAPVKAKENTEAGDTSKQDQRQYKKDTADKSHAERLATATDIYGQGGEKDKLLVLETKKGWEAAEDNPGIDSHFDNMREILEQQKKDIEPSKLKETGIKVLNKLSAGVQDFKLLKNRMLNLYKDKEKGTGLMKSIPREKEKALSDIASGKIPLKPQKDANGDIQLGVIMDGEFLNMGDIGRLLDDNQVDVESQASIIEIKDIQVSIAESAKPGDVMNIDKVRGNIGDVVRKSTNLKSLVHDETFGGTSFADDLYKSDIAGMTYSSLGISNIYDTDGDGKLTSNDNLSIDDRRAIIDELIDNPDNVAMLQEEVVNYFTSHVQRNWDINNPTRSQSNPLPNGSMMGTYKPEQTNTKPPSLKVDLPGAPKRSLSPEEKLKAQLEIKQKSGYSSMDYINMIKA